jgi:hypothetical protein
MTTCATKKGKFKKIDPKVTNITAIWVLRTDKNGKRMALREKIFAF